MYLRSHSDFLCGFLDIFHIINYIFSLVQLYSHKHFVKYIMTFKIYIQILSKLKSFKLNEFKCLKLSDSCVGVFSLSFTEFIHFLFLSAYLRSDDGK